MKLGLTSLDLLAVVKELQLALISARIDNVYQIEGGSFLLKLRGREGYSTIVIDPPRRLNLTNYRLTMPERPTPQATQLRRLLNSRKVEGICQLDFDRILRVDLSGDEGPLQFIVELFGDGNIIVTDGEGTIKHAMMRREMKDRNIKLNFPYQPPPRRGAGIESTPSLDSITSQKVDAVRALTRVFNIPPELAEEGLKRAAIDPGTPAAILDGAKLDSFLEQARNIVRGVGDMRLQPNQVMREGRPVSLHPVVFESDAGEVKPFASFNEAVDDYFSSLTAEESEHRRRSPAMLAISNLESILGKQRSHIAELEDRRSQASEEGRLMISHLAEIQVAIDQIRNLRRAGGGWDEIRKTLAMMGVNDLAPDRATFRIHIGGKGVPIDFRESASANAERRFRESKDAARKLEGLAKAMRETEEKLSKARGGLEKVSPRVVPKSMKREWYEKFRWFRTSDGLLVIGGRDSTQNEIIVKKHLGKRDVFVHADVPGGSVVVIISGDSDPTDLSRREAASFAASYSRAWGAGLAASDAYWVHPEQVSKTPPSGEYLGKGAFMIYGTKNYLRNAPLGLCLGVDISEGAYRVRVSIDPSSFGETSPYVRLAPGDLEGPDITRKVKEILAQRAGSLSGIVHAIPNQDIELLLPKGGCSVS